MQIDIVNVLLLRYLQKFELSGVKRWYVNEMLNSDAQEDCYIIDDVTGKLEPLDERNCVYRYSWLMHDKILNDLPILGIEKRQLRRRLQFLEEISLIKTKVVKGRYSYYRTIPKSIARLYDRSATVINDSLNNESLSSMSGSACHECQTKDPIIIDPIVNIDPSVNIGAADAAPPEPVINLIEKLTVGKDHYYFMDNGKVQFWGKEHDAIDWTAQLPPNHPARIKALELRQRGLI